MKHTWRWLSLIAAVALVAVLGAVADHSTDTACGVRTPAVSASAHNDTATVDGRMMALHQQMTERMRVDDTPAMLQMMNADPMWTQMRTAPLIQEQEEHQRQIDKMLGLGGRDLPLLAQRCQTATTGAGRPSMTSRTAPDVEPPGGNSRVPPR